jgi:sirohydrochlorin ferrochelatase
MKPFKREPFRSLALQRTSERALRGSSYKRKERSDDHANDVIKTMNDLIETSRDGEQGFRTCAQGVASPNLKTLFEAAAQRCAEGAAELDAKVRGLGGQPAQ